LIYIYVALAIQCYCFIFNLFNDCNRWYITCVAKLCRCQRFIYFPFIWSSFLHVW